MLLIIARFLSVWTGTTFPVDLVSSDSMSPSLMEGDVVAWTPVKMEDIRVGDVIVFKSYVHWPDEKIVVHRVSNITRNSRNEILLETKQRKRRIGAKLNVIVKNMKKIFKDLDDNEIIITNDDLDNLNYVQVIIKGKEYIIPLDELYHSMGYFKNYRDETELRHYRQSQNAIKI